MNSDTFPSFAINLILFGSLFILGLYFFIFYVFQKSEKQSFYFSLFNFGISFRLIIATLDNLPFQINLFQKDVILIVDFLLSYSTISIILHFFNSFYKNLIGSKILKLSDFFLMFFSIIFITLKILLPGINLFLNEFVISIYSIYFLILGIKIFHKKLEDYELFTTGLILLLFSAILNSIPWNFGLFQTYLIQLCILLYFGIQSFLLARRMNRSFDRTEILANEIKNSNALAERFNRTYEKFVPKKFLNFINTNFNRDLILGENSEKELTIQFTQIQDFWQIVRGIPSENIYKFLNSYLTRVSPSIQNNNGIIDKFIDNTILSIFPESPYDAVKAAIDLQWEIEVYNIHRRKSGYVPIECGCGIHFGSTRIGIIGDETRQELTVISDTVNLASRIQGLTEKYGARILISLPSLYKCKAIDEIKYRILDMVRVKGKSIHISIGEILISGIDRQTDLKIETKFEFEEGILSYVKADFALSKDHFQKVLNKNPNDKAANMYFERSKYFLETGAGDDFEGIHQWESK